MWRSQTEAAFLPEWNDGTVTLVCVRELRGEVNLPDYNVFKRLMAPAIQLILPNPLWAWRG